jgi:taurine dioxygenase
LNIASLPRRDDFGAIVTGLTPAMIDDDAIRELLRDLWIDKGVVVFKDMTGLDTHMRLSEIFGEPEIHPLLVGVDQPREHYAIADIEYDRDDGDLYLVNGELRGGYSPWHFDLAYMDKINHGGILRPAVLPGRGGETGFIDRITAYDELPDRLKERIEGLNVVYSLFAMDSTKVRFGERPEQCIRLSQRILRAVSHPTTYRRAIHPLVYTQAETGRKVLNVSPWHAMGIAGMENEEGDALLREVVDAGIRPERAYFHHWEADDMVLWDNWRMMHQARGVPPEEARKMRRTTIAGDYALGRFEP